MLGSCADKHLPHHLRCPRNAIFLPSSNGVHVLKLPVFAFAIHPDILVDSEIVGLVVVRNAKDGGAMQHTLVLLATRVGKVVGVPPQQRLPSIQVAELRILQMRLWRGHIVLSSYKGR